MRFPNLGDDRVYALEIAGDSMEPVFREGDVVIVQPGAAVRRGDRVVVRTIAGEVMANAYSDAVFFRSIVTLPLMDGTTTLIAVRNASLGRT